MKLTRMSSPAKIFSLGLAAVFLCGATLAHANEGKHEREGERKEWNEKHPRRAEVNGRLDNQNRRINQEVRDGDMTKAQAAKLHREDRQIRQEERDMAAQNGGHITKQEQQTLNQQENSVSKQIGK